MQTLTLSQWFWNIPKAQKLTFIFQVSFIAGIVVYFVTPTLLLQVLTLCTIITLFPEIVQWLFRQRHQEYATFQTTEEIITEKIDEIVEFIIEHQGLPVLLAKEKFGWSGERCKEIGDLLEQIGPFGRGANNKRILINQDQEYLTYCVEHAINHSPALEHENEN